MSDVGMEYSFKGIVKELISYKSGVASILILVILVGLSIYTVVTIPSSTAIAMWRGENNMWIENPRNAAPEWITYFVHKDLPRTIKVASWEKKFGIVKAVAPIPDTTIKKIHIEISLNYPYDDFPSEVNVFFKAKFNTSKTTPLIRMYWVKPDGTKIPVAEFTMRDPNQILYLSVDQQIYNNLATWLQKEKGFKPYKTVTTQQILFGKITSSIAQGEVEVEKGAYKLVVDATTYNKGDDVDLKLVVYGKVYGIAGTDHLRRPILIALLWGTPVALAFGLTASLAISIIQLFIATISGWYAGIVDSIIQRITEVYMIIPFLPFLIMMAAFYKLDIWTILAVVIILSIFGAGIKSTRALVMQIKEYPYVEAAKAYGASDARIITLYIIPKILPPLVPGLIGSVPGFVFLEAALSLLGLGDPYLPTWGKIINDAYTNGALYKGYYYWILEPSFMLIVTALAFAMLGFALDKIVNPRLREM